MTSKTEQEEFWAGDFGDEYTQRNKGADLIASSTALFAKALGKTSGVETMIEFGANNGRNLNAIKNLIPNIDITAVEINQSAAKELKKIDNVAVINQSLLEFKPTKQYDLSLISGVLIHINPSRLADAYELLYKASSKYIFMTEYFNPTPVELPYRGHSGKLFKRDFASELWDQYPDLKLVDYGFTWRRDPIFPKGDSNWFLFEK